MSSSQQKPSKSSIPWWKESYQSFSDRQTLERLKQCSEIERALLDCEQCQRHLAINRNKGATSGGNNASSGGGRMSSLFKIFGMKRGSNNDATFKTATDGEDANSSINVHSYQRTHHLQDSRAGMKMSRYYNWKLTNVKAQEAVIVMRSDDHHMKMRSLHPDAIGHNVYRSDDSCKSEELPPPLFPSNQQNQSPECSLEHHAVWGCRAMALGCAKELVVLKQCFELKHNFGQDDNSDFKNSTSVKTNNPKYFNYETNAKITEGGSKSKSNVIDDINMSMDCRVDMRKLGRCVSNQWNALDERTGVGADLENGDRI